MTRFGITLGMNTMTTEMRCGSLPIKKMVAYLVGVRMYMITTCLKS